VNARTDPITEALDSFVPSFPPDDGDWEAVLENAAVMAHGATASRYSRVRHALGQRRLALLAAVVTIALTAAGVAIADGFGAFNGIGAAQHPQTSTDTLDPQTLSDLKQSCPSGVTGAAYIPTCNLALDSARLVGKLPNSGENIYVISDTHSDLCVVVQSFTASCGTALNPQHPTTAVTGNGNGDDFVAYGVALDGITAVSFSVAGHDVTVPVKNNVWAYEENSPAGGAGCITVHFADGSTLAPFPNTC
jgi:hypothetical protein